LGLALAVTRAIGFVLFLHISYELNEMQIRLHQ
jgi:hypothetical protein